MGRIETTTTMTDAISQPSLPWRLLTLPEVCEMLGASPRWVYEEVRAGRLPARRIAGAYKFKTAEVEQYVDRSSAGSATA